MPCQGFAPFPWPAGDNLRLHTAPAPGAPSLRVQLDPGQWPRVWSPPEARSMGRRLQTLLQFCAGAASVLQQQGLHSGGFEVQLLDEDPGRACFRFDAPVDAPQHDDGGGPLIPDPYCLMSGGYAGLRQRFQNQPPPPWEKRLPVALWRGSSTGFNGLCEQNLPQNRRYQLCQWSRRLPHRLDARFTAIVQSRDDQARRDLQERLHQEGLLSPRIEPWDAALHRWLIEIDGNVNSWGLLWKLLSGCCVLRVSSSRRQWYHHRLLPWIHVVPVAADLSDLEERLAWCHANPAACRAIAHQGQHLAEAVVAALGEDLMAACRAYARRWVLPDTP